MQLFRAIAYRLQLVNTPPQERQPEVTVFFECDDPDAAPAKLLRLLALTWGCAAPEVEFYNLTPEAELLAGNGLGELHMGDVALLVSGWFNGPLFTAADRTLALVQPRTLQRLAVARAAACRIVEQRLAHTLRAPHNVVARAEHQAPQCMGGYC